MQILRIIIVFFIIFNFPIPIIYDSAVLAAFILVPTYFFNIHLLKRFFSLCRNKYVIIIFLTLVAVILFTLLPAIFHRTFDFSITKAFVLQLFLLIVSLFALPVLEAGGNNKFQNISKVLIGAFLFQSVVEIIAFVLPPFADIVHFFQKESVATKGQGGIRALAISGNPFFDLSSGFGMIYIIFFKYVIDKHNGYFNLKRILLFALLFIGTFFAGRTGFVGLALALIFYLFKVKSFYKRLVSFFKIILVLTAGAFIIYFLLPQEVKDLVSDQLLPFAFEFVYNYINGGEVTTTSTEILNNMYFVISWTTFFLGDGLYTNANGSHYGYTDSGYMREVLYYGIWGPIMLLGYHLQFFRRPFKAIINKLRNNEEGYFNDLIFFLLLLFYTLVLHYKGEVIGFLPISQIILFWIGLTYSERPGKVTERVKILAP